MLTELPTVVIDYLLTYFLSDNDLRVMHQVSKAWKDLIDQRPLITARRMALVQRIREQKENIKKFTQPLVLPPLVEFKATDESKSREQDGKPGSGRTLRPSNANSHLFITPAPSGRAHTRNRKIGRSSGTATRISSTPISSRFQRRYEAGLKLMPGQVLFPCPECKSPVASPALSHVNEEKVKSIFIGTERSLESEYEFPLTPSVDDGYSSMMSRREGSSNQFEFKSPDFESISMSMIVTPPYTPPTYGEAGNHYDSEGSFQELQNTKSPSCPFLASTSALSISDSCPGVKRSISEENLGSPPSISEIEISEDSGFGSPRTNLKARGGSPSPSLLRSLQAKQLKLKSCSSPSLLASEGKDNESNQSMEQTGPVVLQCPDCSYRFCSRCQFREHPGTLCRLIGDMDADEEEDHHYACLGLHTSRPLTRPRPRSAASTSGGKSGKKKGSLRRLAL